MEQEQLGVVIPQDIIEQNELKKRQHRTLRQMPIYRDMANLKYLIIVLYRIIPKKFTKYIDSILLTVCEAKKCIGLAHATRDKVARMEYLDMARVFVEDIQDDFRILLRLGHIDKDTEKRTRKLAKAIVAQTIALRDYTNGQGDLNQ